VEDIGGEPGQVAAAGRGWRRLVPRSLTARLVAGVVALVVVVVLSTGIGTYFALRSFLFTRLDQQVHSTLAQNPEALEQSQDLPTNTRLRAPQRVWWLLITAGVAAEHPPDPGTGSDALDLTPQLLNQIVADARSGREPVRMIKTVAGERVRVAARTTGPPTARVVFAVGLSQVEVERTLRRLVEMELIIGASAVVLALGASRYLIQFSLRRLHRVTRTAQEVAAELSPEGAGLDRRVPVDEPGTEVGQLADSMNTLLAAVETQFAARLENEERMRQFLADASHELRTPLTASSTNSATSTTTRSGR
jgi:two-component system OmpR family sensor kinase